MTDRKTMGSKPAPKTKGTAPSDASVDAMLNSIASSFKGQFAVEGLLGGIGQIAASTLIRTQLERIADAMELGLLDGMYDSADGSTEKDRDQIRKRVVAARYFLRSKVLSRIEREKLAEAGRAATVNAEKP